MLVYIIIIIILARGSQAHPYRDELEAPLGHEAFGNFYYLLTSVFVSFSLCEKLCVLGQNKENHPCSVQHMNI